MGARQAQDRKGLLMHAREQSRGALCMQERLAGHARGKRAIGSIPEAIRLKDTMGLVLKVVTNCAPTYMRLHSVSLPPRRAASPLARSPSHSRAQAGQLGIANTEH